MLYLSLLAGKAENTNTKRKKSTCQVYLRHLNLSSIYKRAKKTMKKQRAEELFEKYIQGRCNPRQRRLVEDWYLETYKNAGELPVADLDSIEQEMRERLPMLLDEKTHHAAKTRRSRLPGVAAAAVVLLLLSAGLYFFLRIPGAGIGEQSVITASEFLPGKNTAILTLGDGTQINLSEEKQGIVNTGEELRYDDGSALADSAMLPESIPLSYAMYQLRTPRGGQYQIELPDGTRVWLNAASLLEYPARFAGPERVVTLTGEAYFEVSKASTPFIVRTAEQRIQVLGTHFNVSAYPDDTHTKTTLLEGSVKVFPEHPGPGGAAFRLLRPAQQSIIRHGKGRVAVRDVDPEKEVAWKNGDFIFDRENLETIMRKISRWYDIDVVIKGEPSDMRYSGAVSRKRDLSAVLQMLELTNDKIKFKFQSTGPEGTERRLIIMR